jgi:tetratricopeptide (TPR) repeat protein
VQQDRSNANLAILKAAVEAEPGNGRHWLAYIEALLAAGQRQNARLVLDHARRHGLRGPAMESLAARLDGPKPNIAAMMMTAIGHHQAGRLREAEGLYRQILAHDGRHADSLHLLGVICGQTGRLDNAVDLLAQAVAVNDRMPAYHASLGLAMEGLGRLDDAAACFDTSLRLKPDQAETHFNLANLLWKLGRKADAEASFAQALRIRADFPEALAGLGNALLERGETAAAIGHLERAARLRPDLVDVLYNLATAWLRQGDRRKATALYRDALRLRPAFPEALSNLGSVIQADGDSEEAIGLYLRALCLTPALKEILSNLGNIFKSLGRLDEAQAVYAHAIAIDPELAEAHFNQSLVHLLRGEFTLGWEKYEWRWRGGTLTMTPRDVPQPRWQGEDIAGKTILLHAEQGFGDTIQFCRYVPLVAERADVILEVPRSLATLMSGLAGAARVIPFGDSLPEFDVHCPLMSLPRLFGTTLGTVPAAIPYLTADPARAAIWRANLASSRRRVGIVWAGSTWHPEERSRSLGLAMMLPLIESTDVAWHVLQKDLRDGDEAILAATPALIDHRAQLADFAETAALVDGLDLVITVDTAVAHLAGAMGKPTWIMLPFAPDWRWLRDRDDSPWYPTARLFRQTTIDGWPDVVARVGRALLSYPATPS